MLHVAIALSFLSVGAGPPAPAPTLSAKELQRLVKSQGAVAAMRSRTVQEFFRRVEAELPDRPPLDARLVEVPGEILDWHRLSGWLLAKRKGELVVLSGVARVAVPLPKGRLAVRDLTPLEAARRQEGGWFQDAEGGSSGQKLVLAWWLARKGQAALAIRLLRQLHFETALTELRLAVTVELQLRMYEAFANRRDYREALRLARLIVMRHKMHAEPGPNLQREPEASRLLLELPRRVEDFRSLHLPTKADWARLRKNMTREEQIDYLCRRLRLRGFVKGDGFRHCWAWTGGERFLRTSTWPPGRPTLPIKPSQFIDPFAELVDGVKVALADVPQLARHMRDDWTRPVVTRRAHGIGLGTLTFPCLEARTRSLLAGLIGELARENICGLDRIPEQDERGRPLSAAAREELAQDKIAKAVAWAKANAGKSEAELEWYWLRKGFAEGETWWGLARRFTHPSVKGDPRAVPLLIAILRRPRASDAEREKTLAHLATVAPGAARGVAVTLLDNGDTGVRVQAAILSVQTPKALKARRVLGDYLASVKAPCIKGDQWETKVVKAVAELLADGSPEARQQALRFFKSNALRHPDYLQRGEALRLMAGEGFKRAYTFYLPLLQNKGRLRDGRAFGTPVAEFFAEEICRHLGRDDEEVQAIVRRHKDIAARIPHLERWLVRRALAARR